MYSTLPVSHHSRFTLRSMFRHGSFVRSWAWSIWRFGARTWTGRLVLAGILAFGGLKAIPKIVAFGRRNITVLYAWAHRYKYQPFPDKNSIRLLKIEKGPDSLQPIYSFEIFPIDAHPEYYALSYTWGKAIEGEKDSRNHYFLTCSNSYIPIAKNLADFLLIWQSKGYTGWFWIDALCINQQDIVEREYQVGLMGKPIPGQRESLYGREFLMKDSIA